METDRLTPRVRSWLLALAALASLVATAGRAEAESAEPGAEPTVVASPFEEGPAEADERAEATPPEEAEPGEAPAPTPERGEAEPALGPPLPAAAPQPPLALPATAALADLRVVAEAPAEPRPWHVRLAAGTSEVFARSASLDPLKGDDHLVFGGAAAEAEWEVVAGIPLLLHVGYLGTGFGDPLFGGQAVDVEVNALVLGLQAGYRLWDALTVFLRGGFVGTWGEVDVEGTSASLASRDFAPGGFGLAGVELLVPRAWMRRGFRTDLFTVGARFEAGYLFLGRLDFGPGEGRDLLEHEEAALGTLVLGGAAMDVAFLLSF